MGDRRRKISEDYDKLAEKQGLEWIGPVVTSTKVKTWWRCDEGHKFEASYNSIGAGRGCPCCAVVARAVALRKTCVDYDDLGRAHGLVWLGPEVPNSHTKTCWRCERGHKWQTTFHAIRRGAGCPYCSGRVRRSPEDYRVLAEGRGFEWLGPEVRNARTNTRWRCGRGHEWEACFNSIRRGSGCLLCTGLAPKSADDYRGLAEVRGLSWLGPEVRNTKARTCWRCSYGHVWEACFNNIQQGYGCPDCANRVNGHRVSLPQRKLCGMLDGQLNYPCEKRYIDVALLGDRIAVEYDCWYWHGNRLEDDGERDRVLLAAGWRVLHVRTNAMLPCQQQLDTAISRLLAGEQVVEIVLPDWGKGKTRHELSACV